MTPPEPGVEGSGSLRRVGVLLPDGGVDVNIVGVVLISPTPTVWFGLCLLTEMQVCIAVLNE